MDLSSAMNAMLQSLDSHCPLLPPKAFEELQIANVQLVDNNVVDSG